MAACIVSYPDPSRVDPDYQYVDQSGAQPEPALLVGGWALQPLWLFWIGPIAGAALAGLFSRWLFVHSVEDRSPGPISDKPVEVLVRQADGIAFDE